MARVAAFLADGLLAQRGGLFPFVPLFLACGIGLFFSLRFEPLVIALVARGFGGGVGLLWYLRSRSPFRPLICALSMVAIGFALGGMRTHVVAGPVLDFRYYGPVTGRVVAIDRSASDAVRITLDRVWLTDVPLAETPRRVRLSLHAKEQGVTPEPGMVVMTTGHLSPPSGAVEPGGFDFRRHAWFLRLGAVGYTRVPLVLWEHAEAGQVIFATRMAVSARIQDALPGATGAFATAILTGDRSAIPRDTLQALRDTNLAHLLAISGLHMGLLSAFVFAFVRLSLLLTPIGLRWPVKKIAAASALVVAAGYLALSGGNVATERAFVMVAVMLVAILFDRRALSLRAVALAALIILVRNPEALLGSGFQMSFAATTALVAIFGAIRDSTVEMPKHRVLRGAVSVFLSSAVAGAATAPFAMAHFNQIAQFGLLANLATVPLMGALVMPFGVLALALMPFGWEIVGLWGMQFGLDWILGVATEIAKWDGAVRPIKTPDPPVLPLIAVGCLLIVIWQGRGRWLGGAPIVLAIALWVQSERPDVLISEGGALVGIMTDQGRALSRETGSGFVASVWLENDGQGLDQMAAARLWTTDHTQFGPVTLHHVYGKRAAKAYNGCDVNDLVVSNVALPERPKPLGCMILSPDQIARDGSLALSLDPTGRIQIEKARDRAGARLWNDRSVRLAQ